MQPWPGGSEEGRTGAPNEVVLEGARLGEDREAREKTQRFRNVSQTFPGDVSGTFPGTPRPAKTFPERFLLISFCCVIARPWLGAHRATHASFDHGRKKTLIH
jgi:hypothetical protein